MTPLPEAAHGVATAGAGRRSAAVTKATTTPSRRRARRAPAAAALPLLLVAVAFCGTISQRAAAQGAAPTPPEAGAPATTPAATAGAAVSPSPLPSSSSPPLEQSFWNRWRAERRAARQERQAAPGGAGAGGENRDGANPAAGQPGPAVQRFLERLPPAERESFLRNFQRWRELSPQEREALRGQAGRRRARMLEAAGRALEESGLKLNDDQREMFLLRYSQERRKLEHELREKAEEERGRRLPAIHEALKREFSAPADAGPKVGPTAPPSPAR